jgi:Putative DNA-binding domain
MEKLCLDKFVDKLNGEKALAVAAMLNEHFIPETFIPEPLKHKFLFNTAVPFEEDRRYEFKEITSARPANVIKHLADEYAVAFLNSEGGRIFWGIRDSDRVVVGVKLTSSERDEIRREVVGKLAGIQPPVDIVRLRLSFHEVFENDLVVPDLLVIELSVPRGEPATMHFTSGDEAFVRLDGVKQKLKGPQIQQWVLGRTKAVGVTATSPSPAERKRQEILAWKGKLVTLSIMNTGRAVMLVGPVAGTSAVMIVDCNEFYGTISMNGSERSIALSNIDISFDDNNKRLDLQERHT